MKPITKNIRARLALPALLLAACGGATTGSTGVPDAGPGGAGCTLAADTTATQVKNTAGCAVLDRDTSSCQAARQAQGLSGYWLKFSCRVTLSSTTAGGAPVVQARADGQPDYKSNYFATASACHESYTGAIQNPNTLSAHSYTINFASSPDTTATPMMGIAVVGLSLNGVPIFGNFAAPGDDIYMEAMTFDRCGGHPEGTGAYHYHAEPYSITDDDDRFVGVLRDGYPVYGRKDPDGTYPTVDAHGGHTGATVDSPATPVYHYHVNQQTSTGKFTLGEKQWFLTTGTFRGAPASCTSCN